MNLFTKLLLTGASAFLAQQASAQILLDNFENTRLLNYPNNGGTLVQSVPNPGPNAMNGSPVCASYVRNATLQYDYMVLKLASGRSFASVADYASGVKRISVKFRSPAAGVPLQLVLQNAAKVALNYPNGNFGGAFNATTTVANAWETLTFTFTAGAPGTFDPTVAPTDVDQMTLLIAPNTMGAGMYYLDDVTGPEAATGGGTSTPVASILLDNYETTRLLSYPNNSGTLTQNAPNPGTNAVNGSTTCGRYVRNAGAQYDYMVLTPNTTPSRFGNVSDFAAGTQRIRVKFRSPAAGVPVQIVMQNAVKTAAGYPNGNYAGTFDATTTVANAWEILTFTFTPGTGGSFDPTVTSNDVDEMTVLIAPNTTGGATYYIDDINGPAPAAGTVTPPGTLAVRQLWDDHEGTRVVKYIAYKTSGSFKIDTLNNATGPNNPSAHVMRYKRLVSQYDALVLHPRGSPLADVTPFRSNTLHMSMKVFSPRPGLLFQITLQDSVTANGNNYPVGRNSEYQATTTATNAWETLSFNFTNSPSATPSTGLNEIVLLIQPNTTVPVRTFIDDWYGPSLTNFLATRTVQTSAAAFAPIYPNPAHDVAHLPFNLTKSATVSLAVYDAMGRRVLDVLSNQTRPAGQFTADVNTTKLAPGLYTCRLVADGVAMTRQLSIQ